MPDTEKIGNHVVGCIDVEAEGAAWWRKQDYDVVYTDPPWTPAKLRDARRAAGYAGAGDYIQLLRTIGYVASRAPAAMVECGRTRTAQWATEAAYSDIPFVGYSHATYGPKDTPYVVWMGGRGPLPGAVDVRGSTEVMRALLSPWVGQAVRVADPWAHLRTAKVCVELGLSFIGTTVHPGRAEELKRLLRRAA